MDHVLKTRSLKHLLFQNLFTQSSLILVTKQSQLLLFFNAVTYFPCVFPGGWVRVGQQLHPGRAALHHLPAEEAGVGRHALEKNSAGPLGAGGTDTHTQLTHCIIQYFCIQALLLYFREPSVDGASCWTSTRAESRASGGYCSLAGPRLLLLCLFIHLFIAFFKSNKWLTVYQKHF